MNLFDLSFRSFYSIKLVAFQASSDAYMKSRLLLPVKSRSMFIFS